MPYKHSMYKGTPITSPFRVAGHFETSALNDPKWPWTQQDQMYTMYVPVPASHEFHCFTISPFLFGFRVSTIWQFSPLQFLPIAPWQCLNALADCLSHKPVYYRLFWLLPFVICHLSIYLSIYLSLYISMCVCICICVSTYQSGQLACRWPFSLVLSYLLFLAWSFFMLPCFFLSLIFLSTFLAVSFTLPLPIACWHKPGFLSAVCHSLCAGMCFSLQMFICMSFHYKYIFVVFYLFLLPFPLAVCRLLCASMCFSLQMFMCLYICLCFLFFLLITLYICCLLLVLSPFCLSVAIRCVPAYMYIYIYIYI